jgi:DNA-binding transcriptional LysR family regulator
MRDVIRFLRCVDESGSIALAARRLHMSQSAFLARLSMLEAATGGKLVRVGHILALTARSRRLLAQAEADGHRLRALR